MSIVLYDLDLACDTSNELAAFIMFCAEHNVTVQLTSSKSTSGYPTANFWAKDREGLEAVLLKHYNGDKQAAQDIINDQLAVDQWWPIST